MEQTEVNKIDQLLRLPAHLNLRDFEEYVIQYLERKADRDLAIRELDEMIGTLQNHILLLSIFIKQNHLFIISKDTLQDASILYTKQELAIRYRVSIRTVSNWILDGLQATEIGGVKRISEQAVQEYIKSNKTKKFNWKSIVSLKPIKII